MIDFQAAEKKRVDEPASDIGLEPLCAMINNNLRCYDLAMELSNSTLEALPQNYAEQVNFEDTCKGFLEVAKVRQRFLFLPGLQSKYSFCISIYGLTVAQMAVEMKFQLDLAIFKVKIYVGFYTSPIWSFDFRKQCIKQFALSLRIQEFRNYLSSFTRKNGARDRLPSTSWQLSVIISQM
jgi:hypothetical protein